MPPSSPPGSQTAAAPQQCPEMRTANTDLVSFFPQLLVHFCSFCPLSWGLGAPPRLLEWKKGEKLQNLGRFPPPPFFFFSHKWRNFLFYKGEMFPFHRFSPNNGCFYLSLFHPIALVLLLYCFAPPVSITAFPHLNQGTQI